MKLAVIGTFYERYESSRTIVEALMGQTRRADEHWLMCESATDMMVLADALRDNPLPGVRLVHLPTPRSSDRYEVIPYSNKINWALDRTDADAIVYLDNGSLPDVEKYQRMLAVLEADPTIGASYCAQQRTGHDDFVSAPESPVTDAYCVLNYTQVMHRRTGDRWTLDMAHADPDLADALFWRSLHKTLGPFHRTVAGILDTHHIPSSKAVGL